MSNTQRLSVLAIIGCAVVAAAALGAPPAPPRRAPSDASAVTASEAASSTEALAAAPLNPYVPPACTGIFTDVACPSGFAVNWIEQFYADGITAGCGTNPLRYLSLIHI